MSISELYMSISGELTSISAHRSQHKMRETPVPAKHAGIRRKGPSAILAPVQCTLVVDTGILRAPTCPHFASSCAQNS